MNPNADTTPPSLEARLACPLSGQPLARGTGPDGAAALVTMDGQHVYPLTNGAANLIPDPLPPELEERAVIWRRLQTNGALSYKMAPFLNLFATGGDEAQDFGGFVDLKGLVLEVGCGPQRQQPAYIQSSEPLVYWGLDPLAGEQPRDFPFVQGLAELLPFEPGLFDSLVYCSCLDHMLDFQRALKEAGRVLKPGGTVNLALDLFEHDDSRVAWWDLLRRGAGQTLRAAVRKGPWWAFKYALAMARLQTPPGAADPFHWQFPTLPAVTSALEKAGFAGLVEQRRGEMIFLRAAKQ